MSKISKILSVMLLRPANHPAGRLHRTNTSHLCLGTLFLALLPRTPPLAIPGSPFGFPNCRPTNVRFDLLTTVWSCSFSLLLLQDPPLAFVSCFFSVRVQTMTILFTIVAVSWNPVPFSLLSPFPPLLAFIAINYFSIWSRVFDV